LIFRFPLKKHMYRGKTVLNHQ